MVQIHCEGLHQRKRLKKPQLSQADPPGAAHGMETAQDLGDAGNASCGLQKLSHAQHKAFPRALQTL